MTPEQQAAFIIAQAACLMAKVAGMQTENRQRERQGMSMLYNEEEFEKAVNASGCGWNDVIRFFGG